MESNKHEALRSISIAKAARASGDKRRALRLIRIARRLDHNVAVDDLLAACENLESTSYVEEKRVDQSPEERADSMCDDYRNGEGTDYTDEHVKLIHEIKRNKDYYAILGVEKSCSVEEIRRAYKKLSLKVHPDKNKAPGSEEAFKKVCKAFKCLSNEGSRRHYDQIGLVDEFEYNQQHGIRSSSNSRRRTTDDDDFDADEVFRSFFGRSQTEMFPTAQVFRTRGMADQQRENINRRFDVKLLIQLLPILIFILFVYSRFGA